MGLQLQTTSLVFQINLIEYIWCPLRELIIITFRMSMLETGFLSMQTEVILTLVL